jgi:transposase-like protein
LPTVQSVWRSVSICKATSPWLLAAGNEGAKFWLAFVTEPKNRGVADILIACDEAVFKLLYLALKNLEKKWTMPIKDWKQALHQFAIVFEGRVPLP